jgi:hypothetical protein
MLKWSDVVESQRRRADEIARADGRHGRRARAPRLASRWVIAYRRALASLGGVLVAVGCRLQSGYQAWTRSDESGYPAALRSDSLIIENNSGPCR